MATGKAWWQCWTDNDDEINILKGELDDTKNKLDEARKEIRRLKYENITLLNKSHPTLTNQSSSDKITDLPHVTRPIPNFDYSSSTMVIHPENTSKQTSAFEKLEEKVMEKLQKKNQNDLQFELLSDNEQYDEPQSEYEKHREKVNELMKQIDRLRNIIQQKDQYIHEKDQCIASLEKQIYEMKLKNMNQSTPLSLASQRDSFSLSMNQHINEIADEDNASQKSYSNRSTSSLHSASNSHHHKKGGSRATRYDNTKEQIDILNNANFKQKSLALCREQFVISKTGKDRGLVLFFQKYLKTKTLDQIFTKSGMATKSDTDRIANATTLVNVLSFAVILYKVKVFQTENPNKKPQINNSDVKNSVKYLAIWLVRTHGDKTRNKYYHNKTKKEYDIYNFKMTKDVFEKNMPRYIQQFAQEEGKHMDSDI